MRILGGFGDVASVVVVVAVEIGVEIGRGIEIGSACKCRH